MSQFPPVFAEGFILALYSFKMMENYTYPYWQCPIVKCLPGYNFLPPTTECEKMYRQGVRSRALTPLMLLSLQWAGKGEIKQWIVLLFFYYIVARAEVITYFSFTWAFTTFFTMYPCLCPKISGASIFSLLSLERNLAVPLSLFSPFF